jgi:short-subunit dehydrogenase
MVFPNAGYLKMGSFIGLTPTEIETTLNVDALQPVYFCKAILPLILERKQKSALLITASGFGTFPTPGVNVYGASKAFATYLG